MLSTTDDLRISELKELSTPQEVMREIPRTLTATRVVMAARMPVSRGDSWRDADLPRAPPCVRAAPRDARSIVISACVMASKVVFDERLMTSS